MCIIAVKIKGSEFPDIQTIKNCMDNNPDGFAAAWNKDGKIHTFRTMDKDEMLSFYENNILTLDPENTALVFHARIATHGSKKVENCHCWTDGNLAFAHNGILYSLKSRDDMTDSETFFRDYFVPIFRKCNQKLAFNVADLMIGSSKFAFIDGRGTVKLMGNYEKYKDKTMKGCLYFSNGTYRKRFSFEPFPSSTNKDNDLFWKSYRESRRSHS